MPSQTSPGMANITKGSEQSQHALLCLSRQMAAVKVSGMTSPTFMSSGKSSYFLTTCISLHALWLYVHRAYISKLNTPQLPQ